MADIITLGPTNTLSLQANTPCQLVASSSGRTNFFVLNTGPGNLYLRYDAPPAGAGDPAAVELPVGKDWFTNFPVYGHDGIFMLADQTGTASVMNMPNPIPAPPAGQFTSGGGGGMNQSPWLSDINASGYSLLNANNITATGNITTTGRISASIVGIGKVPVYALDVQGDVNVTGTYRVNGTPFAPPGVALVQSAVPPTTMPNGSLWFDSASLVLYMLFNGAWIGV